MGVLPPSALPPVEVFQLDARLSVKAEERSFSGAMVWARGRDEETLRLNTPLGQGVAEILRVEDGMELRDAEGRRYRAESGEALLESLLGLAVPRQALLYWLSALPAPGVTHVAEFDAEGRVAALDQAGWRVEYGRYRRLAGRWLPGRLFARRGENLEFRLVVDRLTLDEHAAGGGP